MAFLFADNPLQLAHLINCLTGSAPCFFTWVHIQLSLDLLVPTWLSLNFTCHRALLSPLFYILCTAHVLAVLPSVVFKLIIIIQAYLQCSASDGLAAVVTMQLAMVVLEASMSSNCLHLDAFNRSLYMAVQKAAAEETRLTITFILNFSTSVCNLCAI